MFKNKKNSTKIVSGLKRYSQRWVQTLKSFLTRGLSSIQLGYKDQSIKTNSHQIMVRNGFQKMFRYLLMSAFLLQPLVSIAGDGDLDPGWGTGGIGSAVWSPSQRLGGGAIALQSDGKIVQVGSNRPSYSDRGYDIILARYSTDGSLDSTFGSSGRVSTDFYSSWPQSSDESANSIAIQSDGKIVVGGTTRTDPDNQNGAGFDWQDNNIALVRYNTDGFLDTSFGLNGIVDLDANSNSHDSIAGIALQADGKIIIAALYTVGYDNRFLVMRFNTDGSLDTAFGTNGYVREHFTENVWESPKEVVIQDDGKIVVVGYGQQSNGRYNISMLRLTTTGALDSTFSGDGKLVTLAGYHSQVSTVLIDANGKIMVAGWSSDESTNSSDRNPLLVRYNSNGSLDTTFDSDGMVITTVADAEYPHYSGIALLSTGKIVAVGGYRIPLTYNYSILLTRHNADGSLDTSFDSDDGIVRTNLSEDDNASGVILPSDDKIIVGGNSQVTINSYTTAKLITLRYGTKLVDFTMASNPAEGGTTSPANGTTQVLPPVSQSISATPGIGYHFSNWTTSGPEAVVADPNASSTTVDLSDAATVTANFSIDTYTVNSSTAGGGTIDPLGDQTIDHGATPSFDLTPDGEYQVGDVTGTCGGNLAGSVFATDPVIAACTVIANFELKVAPVITEGGSTRVTMSEDSNPTSFALTLNASDANSNTTLSWSISGAAGHGIATASGTGTSKAISYTPVAQYNGSDSFVVQLSDGELTDTIVVNVTISPVDDPPFVAIPASDVGAAEDADDTSHELNTVFGDIDSVISLTIQNNSNPSLVSTTMVGTVLTLDYLSDQYGSANITIRATADGEMVDDTFTVTVTPVNDAPVFTSSEKMPYKDGDTDAGEVTATDVDVVNGDLVFTLTGGIDISKFSLSITGDLSFNTQPDIKDPVDDNKDGEYEIIVRVSDDEGEFVEQAITVFPGGCTFFTIFIPGGKLAVICL